MSGLDKYLKTFSLKVFKTASFGGRCVKKVGFSIFTNVLQKHLWDATRESNPRPGPLVYFLADLSRLFLLEF